MKLPDLDSQKLEKIVEDLLSKLKEKISKNGGNFKGVILFNGSIIVYNEIIKNLKEELFKFYYESEVTRNKGDLIIGYGDITHMHNLNPSKRRGDLNINVIYDPTSLEKNHINIEDIKNYILMDLQGT